MPACRSRTQRRRYGPRCLLNDQLVSLLVGHKRDALAFDLYSDWTRLGRVAMKGKLGEKLERLREAVEDVVGLGIGEDVKRVLGETAADRPPMVRLKPAFRRREAGQPL